MTDYQLLPDLTREEYEALKADIAEHGVLVPVELDEHGSILDGHHRMQACRELGLPEPPTVVRAGLTDAEKYEHALRLNLQRRHLTQTQKRALIRAELDRDPDRSDRTIGKLVGADHKTVGAVRRGEIPQPEPVVSREEAEQLTRTIREGLAEGDRLIVQALYAGMAPYALVGVFLAQWRKFEKDHAGDTELLAPMRECIVDPRIDAILAWPAGVER